MPTDPIVERLNLVEEENNLLKEKIKKIKVYGRGRRTRTLTGGFGDRCATINTIPLNV